MKVLIIPEDFRKDQYILKPLFTRLFGHLGVRPVEVEVCQNPLLGGVSEALKTDNLTRILERRRGMYDLYILCVDRDGEVGRRQRLDDIEAEIQARFGNMVSFFAENAWEELETWVLAGVNLPGEWRWADVRAEVHVKEQYFEPLAVRRGLAGSTGGGRKALAEEASRRIRAIRRKCPEDFDALAVRLEAGIQAG